MGMSSFEELKKIRKETVYRRGYFFYKNAIFEVLVETREDNTAHKIESSIIDVSCKSPSEELFFADFSVYKYINNNKDELIANAGRLLTTIPQHLHGDIYLCEVKGEIRRYEITEDSAPTIIFDERDNDSKLYYKIAHALIGKKCYSYRTFVQKIAREHEEMSMEAALDYLRDNPSEFTQGREGYDQTEPVISVSRPSINREAGNKDRNTFDFIMIEILLRSDLEIPDIAEYIKENLIDFDGRAREKIAEYKPYQKYGVPIEFLSLYGIATRGKSCIEFRYELRKLND